MEDPRLESVRRLMRSALQEAEEFDVGDAAALRAEWEKQKIVSDAEQSLARAAWEQERAALKNSISALELKAQQALENRRRESRSLEAQREELELAKAAWRRELALQEDKLLQARIALDQEKAETRLRIEALNAHHQRASEASRKEMADLLARLEQAKDDPQRENAALRASLADAQQKLVSAQQEWRRQREEMVQSLDEEFKVKWRVREGWLKEKAELQARIRSLEESLAQTPPAAAAPEEALPPAQTAGEILAASPQQLPAAPEPPGAAPETIPALEPLLDPAWSRIVSLLKPHLSNSTAHLRRLAAGKMPEGQRALLKLAAGDLVRASDHLKVIEQFLQGAGPPPVPGRLEVAAAAALASWEAAFRLRSLTIARRFEGPVGSVPFHAETLRVALYQVIRNAYEAMPRGGCLTVRLAQGPSGEALLSFADTGAGFSPEALEGLFVPFVSAKKGHLGLGLALTRRMLQSWGGDVDAANGPKIGAVVTLRFPASGEAPFL